MPVNGHVEVLACRPQRVPVRVIKMFETLQVLAGLDQHHDTPMALLDGPLYFRHGDVHATYIPQAQAEPIKIGALLSTTGTLGALGTDALPAVQIFVDETNAAGGINGRPLQVVHVDDESKPEQAVSGAKRLIQQDKVVAVLGPVSSVVGRSNSASVLSD